MVPASILIVEDEKLAARHLQMILAGLGYQVAGVVATGESAVEHVSNEEPDLILMDIMLAGEIDGIEAAAQIRAQSNVPVVYLTAYTDEELLERAQKTAPHGYLLKPFRESQILTTIEMALYKHRLETEIRGELEERVRERTEKLLALNQQLRDSEERFRTLVESAPFGLTIFDKDQRFEYFNPTFFRMFGYPPDEMPNEEAWIRKAQPQECPVETELQGSAECDGDAPDGDGWCQQVCAVTCRDGTAKIVSIRSVALGNRKHIRTYRDITAQVAAIEEIASAKTEWEQTFDAVPDPIAIIDNTWHFRRVNRALAQRLGIRPEELVGKDCMEVVHAHSSSGRDCPLVKTIKAGNEQSSDCKLERLGGIFHVTVSPLSDKAGNRMGSVHVSRDITERKRMEEERERLIAELTAAKDALQYQATHDALTHLWNRAAVFEKLSIELARSGREGFPLAVLMIDIDHFKEVNDERGHLAGDAVLRAVAAIVSSCVRPYDYVGRYGGEELIVVLPGCSWETAATTAERLRSRFSTSPVDTPEGSFSITISLGAAVLDGSHSLELDDIIRCADDALYRAKNAGRDRVVVASCLSVPVESPDLQSSTDSEGSAQ